MSAGYLDWNGATEDVIWALSAVLWVFILVTFVREVLASEHKRRHVAAHISLPLLLIAPAFMYIGWLPILAFVIVVVAYILELRYHSAGHGFLFSFGLVLFVGVFAALNMVEFENDEPDSSLKTPQDAFFWAFASLLRINYGRTLNPQTPDGQLLATVVGVCAVLGASLFTGAVVGWVVGAREQEAKDEVVDDVAAQLEGVRQELAALRLAFGEASGEQASRSAPEGTVAP